jgi:hypothetical protein
VGNALKSGQLFNPQAVLTEPDPDILCEYDVEISMSEGFSVTANISRSKKAANQNEKVPVVMCAHPYDNHLTPALEKTPLGGPPQQYRLIPQAGGKPVFFKLTSWDLQLILASNEIIPSPPYRKDVSYNHGEHVLHFGGNFDSHLLLPKIRSRA